MTTSATPVGNPVGNPARTPFSTVNKVGWGWPPSSGWSTW